MQDRLLKDLAQRFGLSLEKGTDNKHIILYSVELEENKAGLLFDVRPAGTYATSVDDLAKAFQRESLPKPTMFIKNIGAKVERNEQVTYFD